MILTSLQAQHCNYYLLDTRRPPRTNCSFALMLLFSNYGFPEAGMKTWQLGVDLTALLLLFCFFCAVLFSQLKIHLGSSWLASLSSIFSQILFFSSFCVFSNCNGLFASHFVTVTCVREMLMHFPCLPQQPTPEFSFLPSYFFICFTHCFIISKGP